MILKIRTTPYNHYFLLTTTASSCQPLLTIATPFPLIHRYNTFTFFDVSQERRILPHMVTEIVSGLDKFRCAITGWMQYRNDNAPFEFQQSSQYDF